MKVTARSSLGVGLTTAFGATMPHRAMAASGGKAKSIIYIYLSGGMSHLDTFDPKTSRDLMGNTESISTNVDGIQFGEHLSKLAKQADKVAVINGMSSRNGAHAEGSYQMLTAYNKIATITHPRIGPFAEQLLGKRGGILPDSVSVGVSTTNAGFLDPALSPLPIADPSGGVPNSTLLTTEDRFQKRMKIAQKLGTQFVEKYKYTGPKAYVEYYDQATKLLQSNELEAFDLSGESNRNDYGMGRLGQGCLLARRLVERGVRVVEVRGGGWDMHESIDTRLGDKLPEFDTAISALLSDLASRGLLDSTLVAVGTEFGRTPSINVNGGRDHFPAAYSTMLAGGGIVGGQTYGKTDKQGRKVTSEEVSPPDFISTIGYAMGIDLEETIYSPSRRPFTFGAGGNP
ncbi:MAG: DUF1501 domain-containing protein, partial [Verrucomicrobiota bacterium]